MTVKKTFSRSTALAVLAAALAHGATPAFAELDISVFGLTTPNTLVRFEHSRPGTISAAAAITGLQPNETLVGIDFRPSNGLLYGVGSTSRIYTINPLTGAATQVGSGAFTPALAGTNFGVDFNPAADRLRVVSDADQSLRINPDTGAVAAQDTSLTYGTSDPQNGVNPAVTSVAYTNSRAAVTVTTLLGIDSALGNMVRIGGANSTPSPNTGVLASFGSLGLGATLSNVGFDIGAGKSPSSILALASVTRSGETASKLYSVDSAGGTAALIGTIGTSNPVTDIAIAPGDFIAPQVLLSAPSSVSLKAFRSNGITVSISCSESCSATAQLVLPAKLASKLGLGSADVAIASSSIAIGDAGNGVLFFTPTPAASAALNSKRGRRVKSAQLTIQAVASDNSGNLGRTSLLVNATK